MYRILGLLFLAIGPTQNDHFSFFFFNVLGLVLCMHAKCNEQKPKTDPCAYPSRTTPRFPPTPSIIDPSSSSSILPPPEYISHVVRYFIHYPMPEGEQSIRSVASRHLHRGTNCLDFITMAENKSRTRRTISVAPNRSYDHRPSSSMAGTRPSHFFKIILPSTIHDKKLVMPSHDVACLLLVSLSFHFLNTMLMLHAAL
jgi:hypothetical protein